MTDIAIRVEHLSKQYRIGAQKHDTLRDAIVHTFKRGHVLTFKRGNEGTSSRSGETIWALRDVSFEVKRGEVVGVIGRNGAGKSTLLKILSRITEPTSGHAEIHGRVGSLLEVGTGFHPELTGRENIYLNGAILGMHKAEIDRKFDEIVAFAEIEKFLDTPVKHYSSGMYVRLAFAVAAHLDPEILLVDEVLAVGDAAFQKKCLGKMGDVAKEGRTVLFVSHNMAAISSLCNRVFLLDGGLLQEGGQPNKVIASYLIPNNQAMGFWESEVVGAPSTKPVVLIQARILDSTGKPTAILGFREGFQIEVYYMITQALRNWAVVVRITNASGQHVFTSWDIDSVRDKASLTAGVYKAICFVPGSYLRPGTYSVTLATYVPKVEIIEYRDNAFGFEISPSGYDFNIGRWGVVTPILDWRIEPASLELPYHS